MAKKQSSKRKFDWMTYSRPARRLSDFQRESFADGLLRPLLELAVEQDGLSMEIRARSAQFYFSGYSLLRVTGDGPFTAEFEVSHLAPRGERTGERLERRMLETTDDVNESQALLQQLVSSIESDWDAERDLSDRAVRMELARANRGLDLYADEYVVVDSDYTYGQRRYDLLALQRTEGVTGPGGFANCELVFVDVRHSARSVTGAAGPAAVGADIADLTKAVGGSHIARVREEVEDLVRQKVALGLLPKDLELRALEERMPQMLVVFGNVEVNAMEHAALELHDKLVARHFPPERLRFVYLPQLEEGPSEELSLREGDAMSYREFKAYRKTLT